MIFQVSKELKLRDFYKNGNKSSSKSARSDECLRYSRTSHLSSINLCRVWKAKWDIPLSWWHPSDWLIPGYFHRLLLLISPIRTAFEVVNGGSYHFSPGSFSFYIVVNNPFANAGNVSLENESLFLRLYRESLMEMGSNKFFPLNHESSKYALQTSYEIWGVTLQWPVSGLFFISVSEHQRLQACRNALSPRSKFPLVNLTTNLTLTNLLIFIALVFIFVQLTWRSFVLFLVSVFV